MEAPLKTRAVKPLFGGLTRAKVHVMRYELGARYGSIFFRQVYWAQFAHQEGWVVKLYDDNGSLLLEANGFEAGSTESQALENAIQRFIKLRDAPYLLIRDLLGQKQFASDDKPPFEVYRLPMELHQEDVTTKQKSRHKKKSVTSKNHKVPHSPRIKLSSLIKLRPAELVGLLSELRVIDLFDRSVWSVGERPAWFHSITSSTQYEDFQEGIDLWVHCNDGAPPIPIQVKSSGTGAMYANTKVPIIVAGQNYTDQFIYKQLIHECDLHRSHYLECVS